MFGFVILTLKPFGLLCDKQTLRPLSKLLTVRGSKPNRKSWSQILQVPIARRPYCRYTCLPSDSFSLTLLIPTTCSMLVQLFPQPPAALLVSACTDIGGVQKPVALPKLQRNVAVSFALMLSRFKCVSLAPPTAPVKLSLLHSMVIRIGLKANALLFLLE